MTRSTLISYSYTHEEKFLAWKSLLSWDYFQVGDLPSWAQFPEFRELVELDQGWAGLLYFMMIEFPEFDGTGSAMFNIAE